MSGNYRDAMNRHPVLFHLLAMDAGSKVLLKSNLARKKRGSNIAVRSWQTAKTRLPGSETEFQICFSSVAFLYNSS